MTNQIQHAAVDNLKSTFFFRFILIMLTLAAGITDVSSQGTWTALTNASPIANDGPLIVLSDGSVLCKTASGGGVGKTWTRLNPPSSNSYLNATWGTSTTMSNDRKRFSSQILKDGRLYVCGGETGAGIASAELFNPVTTSWSAAGAPGATVSNAYSEILDDGTVFQTFGTSASHTCKIYNPTTNSFSSIANSNGIHQDATAHKLADGTILLIDKVIGGGSVNTERYFPSTNSWVVEPSIPFELWSNAGPTIGSSIMLPDGRIWVIGGNGNTALYTPSGSSAVGSWSAGPTLPGGYAQPDGPIAIARDGIVLFTASPIPIVGSIHATPTRFYEFNYLSNTLTQINGPTGLTLPSNTSNQTHLVNLPTGQILLGIEGSTQYYLYTPLGSGLSTLRPTLSGFDATCDHFMAYGTKFNGKSLGSGEGAEGQNSTNYPIIRLSSGATIYFARSFNWNSTSPDYAGNDSCEFDLPAGLPNGSYNLAVIVNGLNNLGTTTFTTYPQLTSALTHTLCSGTSFSYSPTFDRACVTASWTRAAVSGISNPAITTPQTGSINEQLINTTTITKTVTYVYIISNNGYADTVNVTVTVQPKPTVTVSPFSFCATGSATTLTASGANTYSWIPGTTGSTQVVSPTAYTHYTVIGTNSFGCSDTAYSKAHTLPTVNATASDPDICPGASTLISSNTITTETDSLVSSLTSSTAVNSMAFNIMAGSQSITLTKLKLALNGSQLKIWYKPGGYGNTNFTSATGWVQLGGTLNFNALPINTYVDIPLTTTLTIPSNQTYGIIIASDVNLLQLPVSIPFGATHLANDDLSYTSGHIGSAFSGIFSFPVGTPRAIQAGFVYTINNTITSYSWSPSTGLNNNSLQNPTASPVSTTTYTLSVTDNNFCTASTTVLVTPHGNPSISIIAATPTVVCAGSNATMQVTTQNYSNKLTASMSPDNVGTAVVFNISAKNDIVINQLNTFMSTPATSVEVWTKSGGYGSSTFTGTSGWTLLSSNIPIMPSGTSALATIALPSTINLLTGQTLGIMIITNTTNSIHHDATATTSGNLFSTNDDVLIQVGHAATNTGLNFNLTNRAFCGTIGYERSNPIAAYNWQPIQNITNGANTTASIAFTPYQTTTFTITATDIFGCTASGTKKVYVKPLPIVDHVVSPATICPGDTATVTSTLVDFIADSLATPLNNQSANGGNVFNIITGNQPIRITKLKLHLSTGVTQLEVWIKPGGYGNANFTGTSGWTKVGATYSVTGLGAGNLTLVTPTPFTIPASQTYGLMLVTNQSNGMLSSFGNNVGNTITSCAEFYVTEGHAGTSISSYAMNTSPRIWNGEIVFEADNALTASSFSPSASMAATTNALINKAFPSSNTIYTNTITDLNGCSNTLSFGVGLYNYLVGSLNATPDTVCSGNPITLNYTTPPGNQCLGILTNNFTGPYVYANWTTTLTNALGGNVTTTVSNNSVTINGSSGLTEGFTAYTITIPCDGIVSFNWNTSNSTDLFGNNDYPMYSINGGANILFPGYNNVSGAPAEQQGKVTLLMSAGQTLSLKMRNAISFGIGSVTITNFKAPGYSILSQFINWYTATNGGTLVGNTIPATTIPSSNQTYYAEITTAPGGCLNPNRVATNAVVVNASPTLSVNANTSTLCAGSSAILTASGSSASYVWVPGNLTGNQITVTPSTTTTYTVTATNSLGCSITSTIMISVNPIPAITGSANPGAVCPGGAVLLTGTTPSVTWNWQPGNINTSTATVNPLVTTTYTVTATNSLGCSKTQTFVIIVHPLPNLNITATPSHTTCIGNDVTLTASGASSYSWQPGNVTGNSILASASAIGTSVYTVTGTTINGCTASLMQGVVVSAYPSITPSASPSVVCSGSPTTLSVTTTKSDSLSTGMLNNFSGQIAYNIVATSPITLHSLKTLLSGTSGSLQVWYRPGGMSSPVTSGNGWVQLANMASITGAGPGGYSNIPLLNTLNIAQGQTMGIAILTNTVGFILNDATTLPVNTIVTSNSHFGVTSGNIVSTGGTAFTTTVKLWQGEIGYSINSPATYTWQPGNLTGNPVVANPVNTTTYTVTCTNAAGCSVTATKLVTVLPLPSVTLNGNNFVCLGSLGLLTANGAFSYNWQPGNNTGAMLTIAPTASTTYTVTGTNTNGCSATATKLVTVESASITATSTTNPQICIGNSAILQATGGNTYVWNPGNISGAQITVSPLDTTIYTVTGTTSLGCSGTATVTINVSAICNGKLDLKTFLEGYYLGGGLMQPVLLNTGIPGASATQCDSIEVSLHESTFPYTSIKSIQTVLNTDGTVLCSFGTTGTYYVVIKFRNGLETWSANPIAITVSGGLYDFSSAVNKAFGDNQLEIEPGVFAIYSGDINQDGSIDAFDYLLLEPEIVQGNFGYLITDLNGDGVVDAFDFLVMDDNIVNGISLSTP
ncbi:MAG: hypothetical protein JNM95_05385 [Chitinophagaceae bacterium]|nr:hypothetical protein [Chitinophagaceae bacterium]